LQSQNAGILKIFKELIKIIMKQGIHPENYRLVVFQDMSNGFSFLGKSTAPSKENIKWEDGIEYPLIKLEISNTSHPFYTGKMKLVDTAGRVDKFMNRYKDHIGKKKEK
jgi:large subunit ribosomal protein L31